jgi:hypothetical protein
VLIHLASRVGDRRETRAIRRPMGRRSEAQRALADIPESSHLRSALFAERFFIPPRGWQPRGERSPWYGTRCPVGGWSARSA